MPMEMSTTVKQVYSKIIHLFVQPVLLSIIHMYNARYSPTC